MENEVSKWQFIDKYYDFLMEMYKNIRDAYQFEEYDIAFKDMEQIIFHIHKEVENLKDGKEKIKGIKEKIKAIYEIKNEFKLMGFDTDIPYEYRIEKESELKSKLKDAVSDLYFEITAMTTDLNMFMPKMTREEDVSGFDKFKKKYMKENENADNVS